MDERLDVKTSCKAVIDTGLWDGFTSEQRIEWVNNMKLEYCISEREVYRILNETITESFME